MHTSTRSAEKCWLFLVCTVWRFSFEGVQYARSIEGIQHARVLVSYISIRLVRTFTLRRIPFLLFFCAMSSIFFSTRCVQFFLSTRCFHYFYKPKEKGSLRCSFCFCVDSNRGTAQARNERRLPASRDIRSIRVAITIPCQ